MNWKTYFTSPPPNTGWALDSGVAAAVRRDSKGQLHCGAASIPEGTIEVGPVGLQSVDEERLREVLASVQESAAGARRAAVVVPSAWVRCHLLDFDDLPRRQNEIDEVLRWRLKKLLPVPPAEMRLSWAPSAGRQGRRRLLCMAGYEKAFRALEQSFAAFDVVPGLITPRVLALVHGTEALSAPRIVVQQETGFLCLVLVYNGSVQMLRTKPVPARSALWEGTRSELTLALNYVRESVAVEGSIEVAVVAESAEAEQMLRDWWSEQENVVLEARTAVQPCQEPGLAERLGIARLAPVYTVLLGVHE